MARGLEPTDRSRTAEGYRLIATWPYHQSDSHTGFATENRRLAPTDWIRIIEHRSHTFREATQPHGQRELNPFTRQRPSGPDRDQIDVARLQAFGCEGASDRSRRLEFVGWLR